jgi:hypothetical protein
MPGRGFVYMGAASAALAPIAYVKANGAHQGRLVFGQEPEYGPLHGKRRRAHPL